MTSCRARRALETRPGPTLDLEALAGRRVPLAAHYASMSTPGLSTPFGSTARLAARNAAANGSGR